MSDDDKRANEAREPPSARDFDLSWIHEPPADDKKAPPPDEEPVADFPLARGPDESGPDPPAEPAVAEPPPPPRLPPIPGPPPPTAEEASELPRLEPPKLEPPEQREPDAGIPGPAAEPFHETPPPLPETAASEPAAPAPDDGGDPWVTLPLETRPRETAVESPADLLSRARETSRRHQEEEEIRRDFEAVVKDVELHLARGYDLIGLAGYAGSGKTHFLRALSLLLQQQGFEVAEWETLRKSLVPGPTEATVFDYPATGPRGEKWVFVDAAGELYARLRLNDWDLADDSAALLHSLHRCQGLFLTLHLQPGHFRLGDAGSHRWMSVEERRRDAEIQQAQEELEFFDHFLLFLRALLAEGGEVQRLVVRCAEDGLDKALRPYRDAAPRLEIPVQVLFTQADTFAGGRFEVAEAIPLSPRKTTVGVAPFVARHLPTLMGTLLHHCRRFRFDFVQSYEEVRGTGPDGTPTALPKWHVGGELLSCGAMPALEFLVRNLPAKSRLGRLRQRLELGTRGALRLDRLIDRLRRPRRWEGVELPL